MPSDHVELPLSHLSIRVPWHDAGWDGTVCRSPTANPACLILRNVRERRLDAQEEQLAGRHFSELADGQLPPCTRERVSFMSEKPYTVFAKHPYWKEEGPHSHLKPTPLVMPAYSAPCVPFRWMLQETAPELAEGYDVPFRPEAEEKVIELLGWETNWVQDQSNQTALLKSFFSAIVPDRSLCFFYAKQVPFVEDNRRVLIGVGRVNRVDDPIPYDEERSGPLNSMIWENRVHHSIRPGFSDGFLLPYHDALEAQRDDAFIDPAEIAAFASDDHWLEFSFASEHVSHDGAIASLLACDQALERAEELLPSTPVGQCRRWIDARLAELWKLRGPCPGIGAALTAFGIDKGTMIVHSLSSKLGENEDPWPLFEKAFAEPRSVSPGLEARIPYSLRRKWKKLPDERRALLKLLSRFDLTLEQAERMYQETARSDARIETADRELIENPYLLYEVDRGSAGPISFSTVDRGAFPVEAIREAHPMSEPSKVDDPLDDRRVRALLVDELEAETSRSGHTLLGRDQLIRGVRARPLEPPCPIDADALSAMDEDLGRTIRTAALKDGTPAFQLDRLADASEAIRRFISKRAKGARHSLDVDWRQLVDDRFGDLPDNDAEFEDRARTEKARALEELASARASVLIGPAGTGKTEVLALLCEIEEIARGGILLLAPTGKARVQMEMRLVGDRDSIETATIAQFLLPMGRFHPKTGAYTPSTQAPADSWRTVIVDESSMLTEEMLYALLNGLTGLERLILVGDPRQLPPIGSGRPFVDIVNRLGADAVSVGAFPRVGNGFAELTVYRRFADEGAQVVQRELPDLLLAEWFSGEEISPGADEIWARLAVGEDTERVAFRRWTDTRNLQEQVLGLLVEELELDSADDVAGFERSLGGTTHEDIPRRFFWAQRDGDRGAGEAADDWQILSPVRGQAPGTYSLNRFLQRHFRAAVLEEANSRERKVPRPFGIEEIVYGDKVICIRNQQRKRNVYPQEGSLEYIANGEIGIVTGQYKTRHLRSAPWKLEVEFSSQVGTQYGFGAGEFAGESKDGPPLELAYAITVHKAQGSEFRRTLLVIPEPCFNLSRELLYTALTRQRERVLILYQGSISELRRYATPERSETAKRLTNLFDAPQPVQIGERYLEENLIHQTRRGDLVRSKSEVIIADLLFSKKIDYAYESRLDGPGDTFRLPDFTVVDDDSGITVYWEHLGLMHDPDYAKRWKRKQEWYVNQGIELIDHDDPANSAAPRRLLVTVDDEHGGIQSNELEKLIDAVFG